MRIKLNMTILVLDKSVPQSTQLHFQINIRSLSKLTGILLSLFSKTISTKAEMTLGPVPSWSSPWRCSGRRLLNSSLRTNWMAVWQSNMFINLLTDFILFHFHIFWFKISLEVLISANYCKGTSTRQEPEFGTSKNCRKAPKSLLSGWMNCNYTVC